MKILKQTSLYQLLEFPVHGDHTGSLVALEKGDDFPFEIKRVYYVWGTDANVVRGHHAHKELEQVIVVTSGSCDFTLDNGYEKQTVHLDKPNIGLYIKGNIWRTFTNFSPDCVVMVLASMHYDEADYIRNYEEFIKAGCAVKSGAMDEVIGIIKERIEKCKSSGDMFTMPDIDGCAVPKQELPCAGSAIYHSAYTVSLPDGRSVLIDYQSKDKGKTFSVVPDRSCIQVECSDHSNDFSDAWDEKC